MRIALFDYEAGNLHSLAKAIASAGVDLVIERDARRLLEADAIVLPGVGAFDAAASRLAPAREALRDAFASGTPCLGICLGMQLLFESSEEGAEAGIGLLAGRVTRLRSTHVPQIGWNTVDEAATTEPLLARAGLDTVYYANSFVCRPASDAIVRAWSEHEGDRFPAVVRAHRTLGVQFHPEKSSAAGVRFVHAWVDAVREEGS